MKTLLLLPLLTLFIVGCATTPIEPIDDFEVVVRKKVDRCANCPYCTPELNTDNVPPYIPPGRGFQDLIDSELIETDPEPTTVREWMKEHGFNFQRTGDGYFISYNYMGRIGIKGIQRQSKTVVGNESVQIGDAHFEVDTDGSLKVTVAGIGTQRFR